MNGTIHTGMILLAMTGSTIFGSDTDRRFIITVVGVIALIVYRIFRKWPNRLVGGKMDFLERNLVELILAFIIAPGAFKAIMEVANAVIKIF